MGVYQLLITVLGVIALIRYSDTAPVSAWTTPTIGGADGDAAVATALPEDTTLGATSITLVATGATAYTITGQTTSGMFTIDNAGIITFASGSLDYEARTSYLLTVEGSSADPSTGTATVTLNIGDVNEHTPTFLCSTYSICVADATATSTGIRNIKPVDDDHSQTFTYALTGTNNADWTVTGDVLTTAAALDRATTASYVLTVTAEDSLATKRTATSTLSIAVGSVGCTSSCVSTSSANVIGSFALLTLLVALMSMFA